MNNKFFLSLFYLMITMILTSCDHKNEKNEINRNLADAAKYCYNTATDSPEKVYNDATFSQWCEVGGWPVNYATAKNFRANAAYNHSIMAACYLEDALRVARSIKANETMKIIYDAKSNLQIASQNFAIARENYYNTNYDYYINLGNDANNRAIECIEHARRILYE